MSFTEKLSRAQAANASLLCVGLDPQREKMPAALRNSPLFLFEFCREIVAATSDLACAYKPNLAFFEAWGSEGIRQLEKVRGEIPGRIPVILDGKRGDIGSTSAMYARFLFEHLGGDAATVNPYLGGDSLEPFLTYPGRCIFVLCVTSNPGAAELQFGNENAPLYQRVIDMCDRLRTKGQVGLVAGATHVEQLAEIRRLYPHGPILVPGLGAQGGDLNASVRAATKNGTLPAIFNVSRAIIHASEDADFAEVAQRKAHDYREAINKALEI